MSPDPIVTVNRVRDFFERVLWTAGEAGVGAGIDQAATGDITWRAALYAAVLCAIKVAFAQNKGYIPSGDLFPGTVYEEDQ